MEKGLQIVEEEHITRVEYQGKEIILIATAHVSKQSAELVKEVIDREQPDSICVELDEDRYQNIKNPKKWENTDLVQVIKDKKVGFMLAQLVLASYQRKLAKQLDTNVGEEMLQGIRSAEETGAELVLADRNIQTTFMRIWRKMSLKEKFDLLLNLFFALDEEDETEISDEEIAKLLQKDMLEAAMTSMKEEFPKIGDILLCERDQHLANKIKNAPGKKIVAVLGGAHVAGVKEEIFKEQNMTEITSVPACRKSRKNYRLGSAVGHCGIDCLWFCTGLSDRYGASYQLDFVEWFFGSVVHSNYAGASAEYFNCICSGAHFVFESHVGLRMVCRFDGGSYSVSQK